MDGDYFTTDLNVAMQYARREEDKRNPRLMIMRQHAWNHILIVEQISEHCVVSMDSSSVGGQSLRRGTKGSKIRRKMGIKVNGLALACTF